MSDLGGLGVTPALLALCCICAAIAVVAGVCSWVLDDIPESAAMTASQVMGLLAVAAGIAAVALLITAAGVTRVHWDDTCHRMGGVISDSGDCIKPNSIISVP